MPPWKPLLDLTAQDVMSREVIAVPEEMSVHTAAHLLGQSHVSGAPVIDAAGRCVGVLSSTDFMSIVEQGEQAARRDTAASTCCHFDWQVMDEAPGAGDEVRRYMTADPVMVSPTAPIAELARAMVNAHIHRVIVVDGQRRPIGIVSSTDVLAALGRAANSPQEVGVG